MLRTPASRASGHHAAEEAEVVGACDDSSVRSSAGWEVPPELVHRWIGLHGRARVCEWLTDARVRAAWCAEAWELRIEGFLPGGSLSCVLACRRRGGAAAVLKLLAPWAAEAAVAEARALSAWNGLGAVRLLEHTPDGRCMLLRRAIPGHSFSPSDDDAEDCVRVARTLRLLASAPVTAELPPLRVALHGRFERARAEARHGRSFASEEALKSAEVGAEELALTARRQGPLHGDAQNKNLLVDGGEGTLVAIDPEPSVGDPHFDSALWALTHRPGVAVRERCGVLGELLGLDSARLWSWCEVLAPVEVALDTPGRARAHRELLVQSGVWGG